MGFRDEQEASRARIAALERELASRAREVASLRALRKSERPAWLAPVLAAFGAALATSTCAAAIIAVRESPDERYARVVSAANLAVAGAREDARAEIEQEHTAREEAPPSAMASGRLERAEHEDRSMDCSGDRAHRRGSGEHRSGVHDHSRT